MTACRARLLLVDDGSEYARVIDKSLPEFELVASPGRSWLRDGPSALAFLRHQRSAVDVALIDMNFDIADNLLLPLLEAADGDGSSSLRRYQGLAILRAIRQRYADLPVVLLSGKDDVDLAPAAIAGLGQSLGGQGMVFFLGDDDVDTLRIRINAALAAARPVSRDLPEGAAIGAVDRHLLWGADPEMLALRRRLSILARGRAPLIVQGETGTGKSFLVEHFVHPRSGRRGPFIAVDLATVPGELLSAHLFGASKGAYTGANFDRAGVFEAASGGTLFIDEIQSLSPTVQKQLLLVLQDRRIRRLGETSMRPVDVKVVAGSNEDLAAAVSAGHFRQDLYMRLGPATAVTIPPLRRRPEDIEGLMAGFLRNSHGDGGAGEWPELLRQLGFDPVPERVLLQPQSAAAQSAVSDPEQQGGIAGELVLALPAAAWAQFRAHPWPGNLRQLQMAIEGMVRFTLIDACDAVAAGVRLRSRTLQVDPALVAQLLAGGSADFPERTGEGDGIEGHQPSAAVVVGPVELAITLSKGDSLNGVAKAVERQYFTALFKLCAGDFSRMALSLLGDAGRGRAVRLRFNQLGLKVRDLR